ncbi:MAG TPA: carbamoyltransferase HypF [Gemmatimonadales bacterium]|nr:carbamoyltransferase HypF [Gemmatimonadales bacterium]
MTATAPRVREALRLHVAGVVQGVGFRPFVHRLALRHGLAGSVLNSAGDVQIEVEGDPVEIAAFVHELRSEAPPLARIERLDREPCAPSGLEAFSIRASRDEPGRRQPVSPDVALCAACERELFNLANRRYRYPFITCTDCGPRFTVIEAMPYDRERTSMRAFTQCPECLREYHSPRDRRYHSQTNSCPECGPRVWLEMPTNPGRKPGVIESRCSSDALREAADLLAEGKIVAIRGLGGFHLAVDATNEAAVERLRLRKHRDAKPLAIMVRALADARYLAQVSPAEAKLLTSPERPIVLLKRLTDPGRQPGVAPSVAPGLDSLGVMLAYTPLHHLLLDQVKRPLVMTSGNRSEEPIATDNADARGRLAGIADAFLLHDRDIVSRYDDSVVRLAGDVPVFLRRARGYAPLPVDLPFASPRRLVAVGPHLKNTFTLVHGARTYVSQHIGDLENLETLEHFRATLGAYRRLFRIEAEVAVRDLHPGYLSTRVAAEFGLERIISVQHHHAHVAAVLAEHGVTECAVGIAYDGTGYGDDGHVWGAEILVADLAGYRRVAHLRYAPLPGGDLAARTPWRAALGYLSLEPNAAPAFASAFTPVPHAERAVAERQIAQELNAPLASSMGRLFDAAAAILGVRSAARYEGQAAMELEALAGTRPAQPLPFPVAGDGVAGWVLDPVPLLAALGERLARGDDVADLAAAFHESVAAATDELAARVATAAGSRTVALGGGCFQNARLLVSVRARLEARGLRVLVPRRLGPNDGAVSYGQAAVAAAVLRRELGV